VLLVEESGRGPPVRRLGLGLALPVRRILRRSALVRMTLAAGLAVGALVFFGGGRGCAVGAHGASPRKARANPL
jgi:hypothetical protein